MLNCSFGAKHDMVLKQSQQFLPFNSIFLLKVQSLFLKDILYILACMYFVVQYLMDYFFYFKKRKPNKGNTETKCRPMLCALIQTI